MRIAVFVGFILVLGVLWIGGWFIAANQLEAEFIKIQQNLYAKNQQLDCRDSRVSGFPFRIGIFCASTRYVSNISGLVIDTGPMRSAMQFYAPGKAIIEFDGPALIQPPAGNLLEAEWQSLRASVKINLSGPQQLSLQGRDVEIVEQSGGSGKTAISDLQYHARKTGEDSIEVAFSLDNAQPANDALPPFNASAQIRLDGIYQDLLDEMNFIKILKTRGISGKIDAFDYQPETGGRLLITGPIKIDANGLVSGKFKISVSELEKLAAVFSVNVPELESALIQAASIVSLVTRPDENGMLTLPVTAKAGKLYIGPIKFGSLPSLFQ